MADLSCGDASSGWEAHGKPPHGIKEVEESVWNARPGTSA